MRFRYLRIRFFPMNISRIEQRVLHVLAQGGCIRHARGSNGCITEALCITRDGFILADCTPVVLSALRRKRLVESKDSQPYRISDLGRRSVRAQTDNR